MSLEGDLADQDQAKRLMQVMVTPVCRPGRLYGRAIGAVRTGRRGRRFLTLEHDRYLVHLRRDAKPSPSTYPPFHATRWDRAMRVG